MGLFGPLSSTIYSGYGIGAPRVYGNGMQQDGPQQDDSDYAMQLGIPRPLPPARPYSAQPYQQTAGASAPPAASPPANPLAPLPRISTPPLSSMQVLGGFTTRRTQLFGPLSGISV